MSNKEYYENQLKRLKSFEHITIQLTDYEGNKTNYIGLNKESLQAINEFWLGLEFSGMIKKERD